MVGGCGDAAFGRAARAACLPCSSHRRTVLLRVCSKRSALADRLRSSHCACAQRMVLLLATRRLPALEINTIGLPIRLELLVQQDEFWRAVRVRE